MKISYLHEQELIFGNGVKAYDPRIGLLKGGPFGFADIDKEIEFKAINCGVIGTPETIVKMKYFIQKISFGFGANDKTYGSLGFPGLNKLSPLKFSIRILPQWEASIFEREIGRLKSEPDKNKKKNMFIELIEKKIVKILRSDPKPSILFVALSRKISALFQRPGIKSDDIIFANRNYPNTVFESEGDINFRSIVKILGMKYNIPTQLVQESTVDFNAEEDEVTTAWNFAVAQYYKDNSLPWKFSELEQNVCYVGISFYRDFSKKTLAMNTSMAQVFLYTGESFIMEGDSFEWEKTRHEKTPHLDIEKSKSIIDKILKLYKEIKGVYPSRIVIHKTSKFTDEEIEGFYQNKGKIENIDMITINSRSKYRFYRQDKYPIMRGTLISSVNSTKHLLCTFGYIPYLETYPGMRSPIPLEITQFTMNTSIEKICSEILILTRLDWNNIKYCQRMPVTLKFSELVGNILAEKRAREITINPHYRFYM